MTKRARKSWLQERAFLALYVAAHRGHEKLVRKLIEAGNYLRFALDLKIKKMDLIKKNWLRSIKGLQV